MLTDTIENKKCEQSRWRQKDPDAVKTWIIEATRSNLKRIIFAPHRKQQENEVVSYRTLPRQLSTIQKIIRSSYELLKLKYNWDDEGSPGYAKATLDRAGQFLVNQAMYVWEKTNECIDAPAILPGPDGSIDIHWKSDKFEVLINIPKDHEVRATIYGDDLGEFSIKGPIDTSTYNSGLWALMEGTK